MISKLHSHTIPYIENSTCCKVIMLKVIALPHKPARFISNVTSKNKNQHEFAIHLENKTLNGSIYCPLAPGSNPHRAETDIHTQQWVLDKGLFQAESKAYRKFCAASFSTLTANVYRTESKENLDLVNDFIAWLFVHDDARDAPDSKLTHDDIQTMNNTILDALENGTSPPQGTEPLTALIVLTGTLSNAMIDIRSRLLNLTSVDQDREKLTFFIKSMKDYFLANLWEASKRETRDAPTLLNYIDMRQSTSAVYPCLYLGMLTKGLNAPELATNIFMQNMMRKSSNIICFVNDIFSLPKEIKEGTTENLVIVLKERQETTWLEALNRTTGMIDSERVGFNNAKAHFLSTASESSDLIDLMEAWMRGNLDWSQETHRYNRRTT